MKIGSITKSLLSTVLGAGTAAVVAATVALQGDGRIDGLEWLSVIGVGFTGLAVWKIKNLSAGWRKWSKSIVTGVGGIVTSLGTALATHYNGEGFFALFGQITQLQWLMLVVLPILNGGMVAIAPNAEESDDPPQPGGDPVGQYDPADLPSDDPADYENDVTL